MNIISLNTHTVHICALNLYTYRATISLNFLGHIFSQTSHFVLNSKLMQLLETLLLGPFTKPPLFQRNRLTCSGNPSFESCVEGKAQQREISVHSRSSFQRPQH